MLEPLVEVRSVTKRFDIADGAVTVLDDFSIHIPPGELVTILGPSGCGKTTLLRLLAGLERPDDGAVFLGGSPIDGPVEGVSMMFQSYDCFPWMTVASNVRIGLAATKMDESEKQRCVRDALAAVGLTDVAHAYPHQLSGGMRQRVALARTLVGSPRVLLMDEPFGALDAQIREDLQNELLDLFRREALATAVFVTHDVVEAIRLGSRVVVLSPAPARIAYDTPTRRAQATAPSDDELMVRCRKVLRLAKDDSV